MKKSILAFVASLALLANTSFAQIDLGGAISGAINGATGNTQAATGAAAGGAANAQVPGTNVGGNVGANAGLNATGSAAGNVNQGAGQGWLGRVGNDIRGALQQADNGAARLQNNLNPSLQQYGFQPGDQLIGANGQPLNQAQFDQYLQSNPNQVRVLRNGQTVVINGNVQGSGQFRGQGNYGQGQAYGQRGQGYAQGSMQVSGRQRFGITMNPGTNGVVVSGVTVGSPAQQAGIRPGDQIVSVNGQAVSDPNAMIQLVGSSSGNDALDVQYVRNGQTMQAQVNLASNAMAQGGVRQAGYAQGMQGGSMNSADINARLDQLERMIQDLRAQVQQSNGNNGRGQDSNDPNSSDRNSSDRGSEQPSESRQ